MSDDGEQRGKSGASPDDSPAVAFAKTELFSFDNSTGNKLWSGSTLADDSQIVHHLDHVRRLRHDARSAVNQISGYTEMLIEDVEQSGSDEMLSDLKKVYSSAQRLLDLVDSLSTLAFQCPSTPQTVPDSKKPIAVTEPVPTVPRENEHIGRILVVDDEEANRDIFSRQLIRHNHDVLTVGSGSLALELLHDTEIDLVLLDVMMPEMDGFEVLQQIRLEFTPAALPVIMATALGSSEDIVRAMNLGANDYVTKPLDIPVVVARVASQLSLKKARDEVQQLNHRLQSAQDRISRLAESSMEALQDVEMWAAEASQDIARALNVSHIAVWLTENEKVKSVTGTDTLAPTPSEWQKLVISGRNLNRAQDLVVPIIGLSGQIFGALIVPRLQQTLAAPDINLLESFARQLGSAIELRRARQAVSHAKMKRQQQQEALTRRGVEVLRICLRCSRCFPHTVSECEDDEIELIEPPTFPYIINRRYRLTRLLGQGGMGVVFSAFDQRLGREVAIKVVRADHFETDLIRLRFETEARAVARVNHPGVVSIFDSGELEDGGQFIVMELLHGMDLQTVIQRFGPGTPKQVACLLRLAGSALSAAHRAGIVHRDIKPENLFLLGCESSNDLFQVRIVDFGVAKEMDTTTSLTKTGSLVGTPLFMSPEQLLGKRVDFRSDIYSFASVAFLALIGRRVTLEDELINVVLEISQRDAPLVSSLLQSVPAEVDRAFAWALSREPEKRPACAETWVRSFVEALESMDSTVNGWGDCSFTLHESSGDDNFEDEEPTASDVGRYIFDK